MSISPTQEGNFQLKENEIIFYEGQKTNSVNILMQGKMKVYITPFEELDGMDEASIIENSYKLFNIGKNIFTGANDLFLTGKYSLSFKALEGCTIHSFMASNIKNAKSLINSHNDFGAYIVTSISNLITSAHSSLTGLEKHIKALDIITDNLITYFWALKEDFGFKLTPCSSYFRDGLENLHKMRDKNVYIPFDFDAKFLEEDHYDLWELQHLSTEINKSRLEYIKHLSGIPSELLKSFFNSDEYITEYHLRISSDLLSELQYSIKESLRKLENSFKKLYQEYDECIFSQFVKASQEMTENKSDLKTMIDAVDYIAGKIKEYILIYKNDYEYDPKLSIERLDTICTNLRSSSISEVSPEMMNSLMDSIPEELIDSASKILAYSGLPKDKTDIFRKNLDAFRRLKDKLSSDSKTREIKSNITPVFFEIYEAVYKRVVSENNDSILYKMFLNYSFMDEKLLSPLQTIALYKLAGEKNNNNGQVYNMFDWLNRIYSMDKDPSVNEFGLDYNDVFRELSKRRDISPKEKLAYTNNVDGRLNFEINNMLKTNHKICHGQTSTYFPILHDEMITRDLSKAIVTPEAINDCIRRVLEVDFSAFHREINYRNPEKNIEKEYIQKSIIPDFILIPVFGTRSIMWQELSGRNRCTPGRILISVFTSENLYDLILKMIGNLRWELCRTMMGVAWNDITQKSLTSEYTDYIQFYKKNRDLSEEAKDKIKGQMQKFNSKMRDVFTFDYETWINYESKGAVRLNKVVRGILYRYCPLSKPIREQLEKSPLFSEIAIPFKNIRAKQARELENHYQKILKGSSLDSDLEDNLKFYKDM